MSIAINFVCKFNNVEFIIRDLCEAPAEVGNDCTVYPYLVPPRSPLSRKLDRNITSTVL